MTNTTKLALGVVVVAAAVGAWAVWDARPASPHAARRGTAASALPVVAAAPAAPTVSAVRESDPVPASVPSADSVAGSAMQDAGLEHCSIAGDVFDDSQRPLPQRRVELFERDGRSGKQTLVQTLETDGHGAFSVAGVTHLRRAVFDLVAWDGPAAAIASFDPNDARPVHLILGSDKRIEGVVVDSNGEPVPDASIRETFRQRDAGGSGRIPETSALAQASRSAADGTFERDGAPRGFDVTLETRRDGYATSQDPVRVDATPAPARVRIVLTPEAVVEGSVTDRSGSPVAGVRVIAQRVDAEMLAAHGRTGVATTDEDGRYAIRGLEWGTWNLFVSLDEKQQQRWCALPREGLTLDAAHRTEHADLELAQGGELLLHARDAEDGLPIPDLWIGIQSASKPRSGAAIDAVLTDAQGDARLRLPPGPVHPYTSVAPFSSPSWSRTGCEIVEGATLELTVTLRRVLKLRGIVRDLGGFPVAGARIWTVAAPPTDPSRIPARATAFLDRVTVRSRDDGSFELAPMPKHSHLFVRACSDSLGMREPVRVGFEECDRTDLMLTVSPRPANHVQGRVLDGDGRPLGGVELALIERPTRYGVATLQDTQSPDPSLRTRSNEDGTFRFDGVWDGVDYTLAAWHAVPDGQQLRLEDASAAVAPVGVSETRELPDLVIRTTH